MQTFRPIAPTDKLKDSHGKIVGNFDALRSGFEGVEPPQNPVKGQHAFINGQWITWNGTEWVNDGKTHTHDDRYAQKTELTAGLASKANTEHSHAAYPTKVEMNAGLLGKADAVHSHNDVYYTEEEINNLLATEGFTRFLAGFLNTGRHSMYDGDLNIVPVNSVYSISFASPNVSNKPAGAPTTGFGFVHTMFDSSGTSNCIQRLLFVGTSATDLQEWTRAKINDVWGAWKSDTNKTVGGYAPSLTPAPNSIPVAGANGKLAQEWLDGIGQNSGYVYYGTPGTYEFVVPQGVSTVYVEVQGAGGGGGGSTNEGSAGTQGGSSSFGTYISATGGAGGPRGSGVLTPAARGTVSGDNILREPFFCSDGVGTKGGGGGGSRYAPGGPSVDTFSGNTPIGGAHNGYGTGSGGYGGHGGGAGGNGVARVTGLVPGQRVSVVIGAGGEGGISTYRGGRLQPGAPGFVRIWW